MCMLSEIYDKNSESRNSLNKLVTGGGMKLLRLLRLVPRCWMKTPSGWESFSSAQIIKRPLELLCMHSVDVETPHGHGHLCQLWECRFQKNAFGCSKKEQCFIRGIASSEHWGWLWNVMASLLWENGVTLVSVCVQKRISTVFNHQNLRVWDHSGLSKFTGLSNSPLIYLKVAALCEVPVSVGLGLLCVSGEDSKLCQKLLFEENLENNKTLCIIAGFN